MPIEQTKPTDQSMREGSTVLEQSVEQLVTDRVMRAESQVPRDAHGDELREVTEGTPGDDLLSKQAAQPQGNGFPTTMHHRMHRGVAPDVIGVLAVTPDVRVPLRSLGLVALDEGGMDTEERASTPDIDLGAQVGVILALEFTAGGRSHRLSNGTFSH